MYTRPSYSDLKARIGTDLAAIPAVLRDPLAAMWARVANGQHGHLDWIHAQCSLLTCELERLYDWAGLYGVDRLLASFASGSVVASGVDGSQVLAVALLRGANGLDYAVVGSVVLAGDTAVSVRCATAGAAGNLISGQVLALVDPAPGVNGNMAVDALGIGGGADDEAIEAWRARVADEWRTVTTSGARSGKPADYVFWAKAAHASVTGAIVQLHTLGVGTVVARPICAALGDRLPSQAVLDAVSAFYEQIVPATADWRVVAPVVYPVNFTITLDPAVDTAGNRAAIFAALDALLRGLDAGVTAVSWASIDAAINVITALYVLDESGAVAWAGHEIPALQPITWV